MILGSVNPRIRGQRSDFNRYLTDTDSWIFGSVKPRAKGQRSEHTKSAPEGGNPQSGLVDSRAQRDKIPHIQVTDAESLAKTSAAPPGSLSSLNVPQDTQKSQQGERLNTNPQRLAGQANAPKKVRNAQPKRIPKILRFYGDLPPRPHNSQESLGRISKRKRWIQERTTYQGNKLKLRRRAVCLAYLDQLPDGSQTQAQANLGEFLPQTWSNHPAPTKPLIDRRTGSLRRRQTHRLRCRHFVQTINPTPCARNCGCDEGVPLFPALAEKAHPCPQCVADRVSESYSLEAQLLKRYKDFLKDLVFDGHLHLETARSEMSRWESKFGRVWVAQMKQHHRIDFAAAVKDRGMARNSIVYALDGAKSASFAGAPRVKRLSDYRGHERFSEILNLDLNGKGRDQSRKKKARQEAFAVAQECSRARDSRHIPSDLSS